MKGRHGQEMNATGVREGKELTGGWVGGWVAGCPSGLAACAFARARVRARAMVAAAASAAPAAVAVAGLVLVVCGWVGVWVAAKGRKVMNSILDF